MTKADSPDKRVVRYFLSYASKNRKQKDDLLGRLKIRLASETEFNFQVWEDKEILIGEKWHDEIQRALGACDFGLLLISYEFITSDYIEQHELPPLIREDPETGRVKALPVGLCKVVSEGTDWKGLSERQIFRDSQDRYFNQLKGAAKDEFVEGLRKMLRAVAKEYPPRPLPSPDPVVPVAQKVKENSEPSGLPSAASSNFTSFLALIRDHIAAALSLSEFRLPMLEALRRRLAGTATAEEVAGALVAISDLEQLLTLVHDAVVACLRRLHENRDDRLGTCRECAKAVFGWLVLLAVKDDWVRDNENLLNIEIKLKIEDEAVIEVIVSRVDGKPASWGAINGSRLPGDAALGMEACCDMAYGWPEQFQQIVCAVWKEVFDSESRERLTDAELIKLNIRLAKRGQWKKRGYLTVNLGNSGSPKANSELYAKLKREVPNLRLVYIDLDGHGGMLALGEAELGQTIYAFVETIKEYA